MPKISALPTGVALLGNEEVAVVQNGNTVKVPSIYFPELIMPFAPTADEKAGIAGLSAVNPAVADNDPRLTDARQPTPHASTHFTGGSDPLSPLDIAASISVSNYAALRAMTPPVSGNGTAILQGRTTAGDGGSGVFRWASGDQSAKVAADALSGIYVAPTADLTGASGAWVRATTEVTPEMFGAVGDGVADDSTAMLHALTNGYPAVLSKTYNITEDIVPTVPVRNVGCAFTGLTIPEAFGDELFQPQQRRLWKNRTNVSTGYPTIVITGDSLSYNHQDYDATARQNAEDCWPGMNSWSFALRDAIIRQDPNFRHADELPYSTTSTITSLGSNGNSQFVIPFNGRGVTFRATDQTASLKLVIKHMGIQNKVYLWFLKNPTDTGCSFAVKVNGVTQVPVWNTGGTLTSDPYMGRELHFLEVPNVPNSGLWTTIELTNFIGTAAAPHATNRDVTLLGIGSNLVNIKQTGMGGQSSAWLVTNLASKLTSFSPDLAIITIGANDPWAGNPQGLQSVQQYANNLRTIISGIRTAKATAEIMLISPPLSNGSVVPNVTMQRYVNKAREVAYTEGISYIDVPDLLKGTPTGVYRFDSIHYSKQGNNLLLGAVADRLGLFVNPSYLDTAFSVGSYLFDNPKVPAERIYSVWSVSAFSRTLLKGDSNWAVLSLEKLNEYTVKVNTGINSELFKSVILRQFDANTSQKITATPQDYFPGYVLFQLRKQDGSQLVAGDWTTYASSLKFIAEAF